MSDNTHGIPANDSQTGSAQEDVSEIVQRLAEVSQRTSLGTLDGLLNSVPADGDPGYTDAAATAKALARRIGRSAADLQLQLTHI
ncbi:MAG: hypothetical protein ACTS3R_04725 [Inquilinaceae bacterium]